LTFEYLTFEKIYPAMLFALFCYFTIIVAVHRIMMDLLKDGRKRIWRIYSNFTTKPQCGMMVSKNKKEFRLLYLSVK